MLIKICLHFHAIWYNELGFWENYQASLIGKQCRVKIKLCRCASWYGSTPVANALWLIFVKHSLYSIDGDLPFANTTCLHQTSSKKIWKFSINERIIIEWSWKRCVKIMSNSLFATIISKIVCCRCVRMHMQVGKG